MFATYLVDVSHLLCNQAKTLSLLTIIIMSEEEPVEVIEATEPEPEPEPEPPKKKTGRSIRSEAQLKALERGRQRALEKREAIRKQKEQDKKEAIIKEHEASKPEPKPEPIQEDPKPVSSPIPVPVPTPPTPAPKPKPILERRNGRFFLNL